jgi:hypothetical protein
VKIADPGRPPEQTKEKVMAKLVCELRVIPSDTGVEVGGDDLYLGVSATEPGPFLDAGDTVPVVTARRLDPGRARDRARPGPLRLPDVEPHRVDGQPFNDFTADDRRLHVDKTPTTDVIGTAWYRPLGKVGGPDVPGSQPALGKLRRSLEDMRTRAGELADHLAKR